MNDINTGLPSQMVSRSTKETKEWQEKTIDAIIGDSDYGGLRVSRWYILSLYDYYNGIIRNSDYRYVTNPYQLKEAKAFPAKLRNFNILKPNVDIILGENAKRPILHSVIVSNPDVVTQKEEEKYKIFSMFLKNLLVSDLRQNGDFIGEPREVEDPEKVEKEFESTYQDYRAIMGQEALDYLRYKLKLDRLRKGKMWKDWTVGGMVFSKKQLVSGEAHYIRLNPAYVDFCMSTNLDFVEDAKWAMYYDYLTIDGILNLHWRDLTEDNIKSLERPSTDNDDSPILVDTRQRLDDIDRRSGSGEDELVNNAVEEHRDGIECVYVTWKSMRKVGIRTYTGVFGTEEEDIVEEGYEKQEGEEIEWKWVNEAWEGTRINGNIYVGVGPVKPQRGSMDNPSICKLPINGRVYSDENSKPMSFLAQGIPYQLTYNVYMYRLEKDIARSKGMIGQIDLSSIPSMWRGNLDKYFYYLDALGIAFYESYDETTGRHMPTNTMRSVIDLTVKTIEQYIALLNFCRDQLDQLQGITRQRKGQMSPYDLKSTTEQGIIQSSNATEELFDQYDEFWEKEYEGLVDLGKYAFITDKSASYVAPDGSVQMLQLDGIEYMESEFGIFTSTSLEDATKIERLRGLGESMVNAGWPVSTIADIMDTNNYVQLRQKIKDAEKNQSELQQAQAQAEREMKQQEMQEKEVQRAYEAEQNELDRQTRIEIAYIQKDEQDSLKQRSAADEARLKNKELDIEREKNRSDAQLKRKEIEVKAKAASKPNQGK